MPYLLALLIGVVSGSRSLTPIAVVSWAAYLGRLPLRGTWLAFLGHPDAAYVLAAFAAAELVADKLPRTPSRKAPLGVAVRVVTGALCGGALGAASGALVPGAILGAVGAVIGAFGGYALRMRLAKAFGRDLPAALVEDAIAIAAALLIVLVA